MEIDYIDNFLDTIILYNQLFSLFLDAGMQFLMRCWNKKQLFWKHYYCDFLFNDFRPTFHDTNGKILLFHFSLPTRMRKNSWKSSGSTWSLIKPLTFRHDFETPVCFVSCLLPQRLNFVTFLDTGIQLLILFYQFVPSDFLGSGREVAVFLPPNWKIGFLRPTIIRARCMKARQQYRARKNNHKSSM